MAGIFQQKKLSRPVIERDGSDLQITIPSAGSLIDECIAGLVFAGMLTGAVFGFWPLDPGRLAIILVFIPLAGYIFKGLLEQTTGDQIVTVRAGKIACSVRTRLWTRTQSLNVCDVTEVSVVGSWGLGGVALIGKGRKYPALKSILKEDANRCALQLQAAIKPS